MEKVIAWTDSKGIRGKVSAEFDDVMFVSSFEEFKANVSADTLNIMDTQYFGAGDFLIEEKTNSFVKGNPGIEIHIFVFEERDREKISSGIGTGYIRRDSPNAIVYSSLPDIPIKERIEHKI